MRTRTTAIVVVLAATLSAWSPAASSAAIRLTSPVFAPGTPIPAVHTCDGADRSPALRWSGVPRRAQELAIVLEDPDAPRRTFVHWVAFGIDPGARSVFAGRLPRGARQARNDFGAARYDGPCPPRGDDPHRYRFTLYALSRPLGLRNGVAASTALRAIRRTDVASGILRGTYGR